MVSISRKAILSRLHAEETNSAWADAVDAGWYGSLGTWNEDVGPPAVGSIIDSVVATLVEYTHGPGDPIVDGDSPLSGSTLIDGELESVGSTVAGVAEFEGSWGEEDLTFEVTFSAQRCSVN